MPELQVKDRNLLSLSIAGLGIHLHCDDPEPLKTLRSRYQEFPLHHQPSMKLEIRLTGQERPSALLDTGMRFEMDGVYFKAPGYQGQIQVEQGTGELALSSMQPVGDIDYFIRVATALLAFRAGGLMLHAAGILRGGKAYLFFGHSGAGKSTVARLSSNDTVLNDDLLVLLPEVAGWRVHGTPFWNPTQVKPSPQSAPLKALFKLVQSQVVQLEPISASSALAELLANTPIIPADPNRGSLLLCRLHQLIRGIPVKRLFFLPDASFWDPITEQVL